MYDGGEKYRQSWRQRAARHMERLSARYEEGRRLAGECARLLADRYGAGRVILIGSLCANAPRHERPDIDLVVSDLPDARYFTALRDLYRLVPPGWEIDLIPWEDADPRLRAKAEEGVLLHAPSPKDTRG